MDLFKLKVLGTVNGLAVVGLLKGGVIAEGEGGFPSINVMTFLNCFD